MHTAAGVNLAVVYDAENHQAVFCQGLYIKGRIMYTAAGVNSVVVYDAENHQAVFCQGLYIQCRL